jgi:hypothetical protein
VRVFAFLEFPIRRILAAGLALALIFAAHGVTVPITLAVNPDGTFDTKYPTGNKPPTGGTLACDNSAAPSLVGLQTGSAYSANYRQYFSGSAAATATLTVVNVPGSTTDATTQWSISSAGAGNNLTNAALAAGSGSLKVRGTTGGNSADCGTQNWSYVAPPGSDTTPPNPVTGITATPGTNSMVVAFDQTNDPNDAVARKGVATYRIKLNGVTVDTLAAPNAGLVNDFTATAIGTGVTGSATQGSGANGGKQTVATTGVAGYGLEGGQNDAIEAALAPVAGTTPCVYGQPAAIPASASYNKAFVDIRNSSSATAAHIAGVVLRQTSPAGYYLQYSVRPSDGGSLTTSTSLSLTGVAYVAVCIASNVATVYYSYDGGAWVVGFSNIAITLTDSKLAGCGVAATNNGSTGVAISVDFTYCQVTSSGRASKTVSSSCTVTCLWAMTAIDAESVPNESAATGSVSAIPNTSSGASLKFSPGHYVRAHTHNLSCGTGCDSQRHSLYSQFSLDTDSHVIGTEIWIDWKYLESDSGNSFTAGFSWLTNELAYVAANFPGKKVGVMLNISPYGPSNISQANQWFPQYFVDAGCVYIEGSAGASGGSDSLNWYKTNSTCLSYFTRLMNAYGAQFDSNTTLAFIRIQQETDDAIGNVGINAAAEDAAWKNIAQASRTAFPTTPIWIPVNWTGVNTPASIEALLLYYKSIAVGAGNGDTQPKDLAYSCPSTAWVCVVLGLNSSIGGTNHSNCGEFLSMGSVELSEMGYNAVVDPGGGLTSQQVADSWNVDTCQQFGIWEPNFGETGTPDTMYWNGAHGQKWAIDTIPLTHLTKPSGVP